MADVDNQQQNRRLEYELIHKTRMDWVNTMMIWRTITIPLSLTLIGVLASWNREPNLWFVGWLLGVVLLFFWRFMESHIELQIRGLYTRMITLEQQLGMTFFSHYLWFNLRNKDYVQEYQNADFNYQGVKNSLTNIGTRGHNVNMGFITAYCLLGIFTFYFLICIGYYDFECWLIILSTSVVAIILGILSYFWINIFRKVNLLKAE